MPWRTRSWRRRSHRPPRGKPTWPATLATVGKQLAAIRSFEEPSRGVLSAELSDRKEAMLLEAARPRRAEKRLALKGKLRKAMEAKRGR